MDDFLALPPAPQPAPPKKRGRPSNAELAVRADAAAAKAMLGDADGEELPDGALPNMARLLRGCRITYLAQLFGTEPRRIGRKLANCPVLRWERHKGEEVAVYDFRTACSYLLEPKIDMETWIKSQTSLSLPPAINKAFWEAMRTKMRVMAEAGQYWHDEEVLTVFGKVAMLIKETTLLWIEDLPDKSNLSSENYHALRRMVDELLKAIQADLQNLPLRSKTHPIVRSIEQDMAGSDGLDDD
jgi:hypothetical protein